MLVKGISVANALLYVATVGIWGTTFFAITLQFGVVPLEISISYRFALAAAIFFAFALASGRSLRFRLRDHGAFMLLGIFLFSFHFLAVYASAGLIASGLTSVAFSTIVLFNIGLGTFFLKVPLQPRIVVGAMLGIAGIALVFWRDVATFDFGDVALAGLGLAILGAALASVGNIVSARIQSRKVPIVQANAYGMAYGAIFIAAFGAVRGQPFVFDWSLIYAGSLVYLAIVSTVLAFAFYLTLLGRIGAARAGYMWVLFPIVALAMSTFLEGYAWTPLAATGVAVVLLGNALVLTPRGTFRASGTREPSNDEV